MLLELSTLCAVLTFPLSTFRPVESSPAAPEAQEKSVAADDSVDAASVAAQLEREAAFAKLLSGATLAGKWRLVRGEELGEESGERYTLGEVRKVEGNRWIVEARIQFGDKDVKLPVPVRVDWAGDTPVLSVTDMGFPGIGKYTARVIFHNGLYTGTWFGVGYGGFLSGRIVAAEGASGNSGEKKSAPDSSATPDAEAEEKSE